MKYVEINAATGAVSWDAYFEYLRSIEQRVPPLLYKYAVDWDHYSLDGANSLHDAWLVEVQFSYMQQQLMLAFLGQKHDRTHVFRYNGVKSYRFDLSVEYRYGDRDILAHEFRVEDSGELTHEILFPNDKRIFITAEAILPQVGLQS